MNPAIRSKAERSFVNACNTADATGKVANPIIDTAAQA